MNPSPIRSRVAWLLPISVLAVALAAVLASNVARAAGDSEEARAYFDKATASFALGHYPVAADNFEKAFEIKSDPALLYNAAQAHRLAGNKERALVLYQNYLRLYPKAGKRAEVEARVEELKKAIERDREVATSPPTTTMPPGPPAAVGEPTGGGTSPGFTPAPPASRSGDGAAPPPARGSTVAAAGSGAPAVDLRASPSSSPPPAMLVSQPDSGESKSLTQKPLFWAVVAGGVATVVVVVLVVALSGPKDPSPTLGVLK